MKIKHNEIEISKEAPFANCKLGREKYAYTLTEIVGNYKDGFVLAINNEWGTGKTTFVRMWQKQLDLKGYKTLYFNAWENDFDSNPLVAIMAELNSLTKKKTEKVFKSMVEKGSILAKNIVPLLIKTAAKKYTGSENVAELAKETAAAATEIFSKEIENYTQKKDGLKEFKASLEKFVKESTEDKPLVFIVDELDRCRPNYAVEVLEQIKHLFSVPGIVFILSIDKIQLGHAVRGVYGNDNINADEYLRRFIDVEYSIPEPKTIEFCNYLYDYFEFATFFHSEKRKQIGEFVNDSKSLISVASTLFEKRGITLRQQEKVFAHARIGLVFFRENNYVFPTLYLLLTFLKNFHKDIYDKIKAFTYTPHDVMVQYSVLLPSRMEKDKMRIFIHLEAILVYMYNNSLPKELQEKLIDKNVQTGVLYSAVTSRLDTSEGSNVFLSSLSSIASNWNIESVGIEYLLKKIDLTEDIVIK